MSYLKNYQYDIFVSYAHGPAPAVAYHGAGAQRQDLLSNWTRKFADDLRDQIEIHLGTKDPARRVQIWMDPDLEGHKPITAALKEKIELSALMLVVMSPFYLGSTWCRQELEWFATAGSRGGDDRVFVVRAFPSDEIGWPDALKDASGVALSGYCFHAPTDVDEPGEPHGWPRPTEVDREYWSQLKVLARHITKQLKQIDWLEANQGGTESSRIQTTAGDKPSGVPPFVGRSVLLGFMHDTLDEVRDEIRETLSRSGMTVYPLESDEICDEASVKAMFDNYLGKVEAFVLVANEYCGKWPRGQNGGFVSFQVQRARENNLPCYLWLQAEDPARIKQPEYRTYLETLISQASDAQLILQHDDVASFTAYVKGELNRKKATSPDGEQFAVVCSNCSSQKPTHRNFQELVLTTIGETDRWAVVPDFENAPNGQIRLEALKQEIDRADTVILLCFDQDWIWAQYVWRELKQISGNGDARKAQILVAGPEDQRKGSLRAPNGKVRTVNGIDVAANLVKEELKREILSAINAR